MKRPRITSPAGLRSRRESNRLPEPVPPRVPYVVDVVVPFWSGDRQWLAECLTALDAQQHCQPVLHVIADNCEFPDLPKLAAKVIRYRHNRTGAQGPYRLTNSLVRHGHCVSDVLALQDCDDISFPNRLWVQRSLIDQTASAMISSAMQQFTNSDTAALRARLDRNPVIYPGQVAATVPRGRCVNSTRLVRLSTFRALNGFQNLVCTGDFDFDNRARFGRVGKIIDHREVLARRRLHDASLSNGVAPMKSPQRDRDIAATMRALGRVSGCRKCAPNYGAMASAFELEVVA